MAELGREPECREALDRLYHYLDGELTEDRRRQIKQHLETCMPCLEAFDFEAELKLLIARRCHDEVPTHLQVRVRRALAVASTTGDPGEGGNFGGDRAGSSESETSVDQVWADRVPDVDAGPSRERDDPAN